MITKTRIFFAATFILMCTIVPILATAGELAVSVTGVRSAKGTIMAQVLKADPAKGTTTKVAATMQAAKVGTVDLLFGNLEPGDYAVMLFHDENGNGEMDKNVFGIPTEGYGFSNNAKGSFGPPKFSAMKVTVTATGRITTTAPLTY